MSLVISLTVLSGCPTEGVTIGPTAIYNADRHLARAIERENEVAAIEALANLVATTARSRVNLSFEREARVVAELTSPRAVGAAIAACQAPPWRGEISGPSSREFEISTDQTLVLDDLTFRGGELGTIYVRSESMLPIEVQILGSADGLPCQRNVPTGRAICTFQPTDETPVRVIIQATTMRSGTVVVITN